MSLEGKYLNYLRYIQGRKPTDVIPRELGMSMESLGPQAMEIFNARKGQVENWAKGSSEYDAHLGMFIEGLMLGAYLANRKGIIQ